MPADVVAAVTNVAATVRGPPVANPVVVRKTSGKAWCPKENMALWEAYLFISERLDGNGTSQPRSDL